MINKDTLIEYVRIISGYDADTDRTLVDFSLNEEKRNIVNLVNNEAKKDKKLANLLEDLKYSNNKVSVIESYFNVKDKKNNKSSKKEISNVSNYNKERINNYGFINMSSLGAIVGIVTLILAMAITLGTR